MPFSKISDFQKSFPGVKNLTPEQKQKALDMFNAMMKSGDMEEGMAIATAMKKAKMMCEKEMMSDGSISYIQMLSGSRSVIEVLRTGTVYDRGLKITEEMLSDFVDNFNEGVYGTEVQVNLGHNRDGEAAGWIKRLFTEGERLMAEVEWTPIGVEKITNKQYRFTSSEFSLSYPHYKTGEKVKNVFIGCALTNIPAMKGMAPVQLQEQYQYFINNLKNMDTLNELFAILNGKEKVSKIEFSEFKELAETSKNKAAAKMITELEEKVEEEKKEEPPVETEEEKKAKEDAETAKKKEEDDKAAADAEAKKKEEEEKAKAKADEEVKKAEELKDKSGLTQLSEDEINTLKEKAAKTEKLEEQIKIHELMETVEKDLCLSADKKIGFKNDKTTVTKIATFMASLSQEQVTQFGELLGEIRTVDLSVHGITPKSTFSSTRVKARNGIYFLLDRQISERPSSFLTDSAVLFPLFLMIELALS